MISTRANLLLEVWLIFMLVALPLYAQDQAEYEFQLEEFTKKTWEWQGSITLSGAHKEYNRDSVFYPLRFPEEDIRSGQESELILSLEGRWDWDWSRLYLAGDGAARSGVNPDTQEDQALLREGYWELAVFSPHSLQLGKQLLRWGKGYAFNPVAFLERPKNPEDPEADREGLWLAQGLLIFGQWGVLQNSSLQAVYLPIREEANNDFQDNLETGEEIWALRLYALIGTTDIDLYTVGLVKRDSEFSGIDFSSNLTSYFEIHGEYARGALSDPIDETSEQWLLGLRYLTENDITWILERYHTDQGMTAEESENLYRSLQTKPNPSLQTTAASIQQSRTVNRTYGYLKASIQEPFDWLYVTTSIALLQNLDDASRSWLLLASYLPVTNLELKGSWQYFEGNRFTHYGENLAAQKLTLTVGYSF